MNNRFLRIIVAILLVVFGSVLTLGNIGIVTPEINNIWYITYPTLFVIYGMKLVVNRIRFRRGSWVFGSFLIVFGSLLILDRFDIIYFKFGDVFKLWPLLIIYLGFMILCYSYKRKRKSKKIIKETSKSSKFSIGSYKYNKQNWKVEPLYLTNLAGDFYFDFTKTFIPEAKTPITIHAIVGDVYIFMPDNVDFKVEASVKAGDIKVFDQRVNGINRSLLYETNNFQTAKRKIHFILNLKAGSVRVDCIRRKKDI